MSTLYTFIDIFLFTQSLLEQTDFVVVGVVGYQGVGKSTILSMLGDSKNEDAYKRLLNFSLYFLIEIGNLIAINIGF